MNRRSLRRLCAALVLIAALVRCGAPTVQADLVTPDPTPTLTPTPEVWDLPAPVIPEPFGVQVHFMHPNAREVGRLAAGGFRWVRMDLFWNEVERSPGRYDFSAYSKGWRARSGRNQPSFLWMRRCCRCNRR